MAEDVFLKIDGIPGESKDAKHSGEIEVKSWSWGAQQFGTFASGGGGGAGKVSMSDITFMQTMQKSSPLLMLHCANGKHIPQAILTARKAGEDQQEYLKITLSDILVSSYQTGGTGAGEVPTESISLNFAKFEMAYAEQKADGSLEGPVTKGWDLKQNKVA